MLHVLTCLLSTLFADTWGILFRIGPYSIFRKVFDTYSNVKMICELVPNTGDPWNRLRFGFQL